MIDLRSGAVFVQTNDADSNAVVAFGRDSDGRLSTAGTFSTGGRGNGTPHLPSQGSLVADGGRLFVVNAGSDDVSVFAIEAGGLKLLARSSAAGSGPRSVAVHGDLVYVLGHDGIAGFRLAADGGLTAIATSPLSASEADGAQIAFAPGGKTLVVTERVTDRISTYEVQGDGTLEGPFANASSGPTPYGFDFAGSTLVVTEAFGGQVGAAAASSYRLNGGPELEAVSASVQDTRSEVCWAAASKDGHFVYVTNFGDGTISSYGVGADGRLVLLEPVAASTRLGEKGIRDEAFSADGRFLYALDADSQQVFGFTLAAEGALSPLGAVDGLPATVAGLAAV